MCNQARAGSPPPVGAVSNRDNVEARLQSAPTGFVLHLS